MARRSGGSPIRRHRPARLAGVVLLSTVLVVAAGPARAALLAAGTAVVWLVVRLPRLEARLFDSHRATTSPERPVVVAGPRWPAGGPPVGHEAHRAYARALHAVTGAYLAELEREAQR